MNVMPSSSARSNVRAASASSLGPYGPDMPQQPSPMAETAGPLLPSVRCSIAPGFRRTSAVPFSTRPMESAGPCETLQRTMTLTNSSGHRLTLTPLGAAMTGIFVPDRSGNVASVTVDAGGSAGKTIGRYANRIARGTFTLDGAAVVLLTNEGRNTLHGGPDGFSKRT